MSTHYNLGSLYGFGLGGNEIEAASKNAAKGAAIATGVITTAGTVATTAAAAGATGIATASAAVGSIVPVVGTAIGLVVGAAVGLILAKAGGVKQDRFFDRYFEVKKALNDAGYTYPGHDDLITKLKIRKTQVADNKTKGSYAPEFARLMEYVYTRLEKDNPGLGKYWAANFPMSMANKGNIKNESVAKLKELVKMFPPLTYRGQQPFAADADGKLLKQITSTGTQSIDASGNLTVDNIPRDSQGNQILSQQTIDEADKLEAKQAGTGWMVGGILALAIGGMLLSGTSNNSPDSNPRRSKN